MTDRLERWKGRRAEIFPTIGTDLDIFEFFEFCTADLSRVAIIDTETTGLDAETDEILQISIYKPTGLTYDWHVRPIVATSWPDAERVNGIAPEMTLGWQTIADVKQNVESVLNRCTVFTGYNIDFDLAFLLESGIKVPYRPTFDVMAEAREMLTEPDIFGERPWISLIRACQKCGVEWSGPAHDARYDVVATWDLATALHSLNIRQLPFMMQNNLLELYEEIAEANAYQGMTPQELKEVLRL